MNIKDVMLISMISDLQGTKKYSTSRKYDSAEYVKKSIKYLIIGSLIGLFIAWILTLDSSSFVPETNIAKMRVIIVVAFGYIGFSFHAGMSLFDSDVSFVTILVLFFTGILALVFAFATAIGALIAIPRFIYKLRDIC